MAGIILLLTILSTVSCEGTYSMSRLKSKWSDMENVCNPMQYATPNVQVISAYPPPKYNVTNLDKTHNEDLWVGYYQVETAFEYKGCVQETQLFSNNNNDPPIIPIKGDPGHCFPGCDESTVIGVTKTRCYCLRDRDAYSITNYNETGCKEMCTHPLVACGKEVSQKENSYLSIYEIKSTVDFTSIYSSETQNEEKKCQQISENNLERTKYWTGCRLKNGVILCSYDGRVELVGCKGDSEYCSWLNAANVCFQSGGIPSYSSNSKSSIEDFKPFWTGVFKTNVVYKYNAYIPGERRQDQKKFGYLTQGSKELRFTESDLMRKILCQGSDTKSAKTLKPLKEDKFDWIPVFAVIAIVSIPVLVIYLFRSRLQQAYRYINGRCIRRQQSAEIKCEREFIDDPNPTNRETPVSNDAVGGATKTINPTNEETPVSNDTVCGASKTIQDHDKERNEEKHGYGASANEPLEEDRIDTFN